MTEQAQPGGSDPAPAEAVSTPANEVAPPDTQETDAGTVEEEATPDAGAEPSEPKKQSKGFQKRIDELTARQRDAERDRDHWRELAMRQGQPQQPQQPAPQQIPPDIAAQIGAPPDPAKFTLGEYDPQYAAAIAEHRLLTRMAQAEAQRRAAEAQHADTRFLATVTERVAAAAERLPGISVDALADFGRQVPNHVANAVADLIATSDYGADVAAWLMGNEAEVRRLATLSPAGLHRALGRHEERIERARAAPSATKAPPPPKTVSGSAPGKRSVTDPDLSMEEYVRLRGLPT